MPLVRYRFNQPFNPTLEGDNHWALTRQDGSEAAVIFQYWLLAQCDTYGSVRVGVAMSYMVTTY